MHKATVWSTMIGKKFYFKNRTKYYNYTKLGQSIGYYRTFINMSIENKYFLLRITLAFIFSMLYLICEYYVIDTWRFKHCLFFIHKQHRKPKSHFLRYSAGNLQEYIQLFQQVLFKNTTWCRKKYGDYNQFWNSRGKYLKCNNV